ncbi:NADPH oxidase activator 1, partial [Haliaeetus albicilla]
RDSESGYYRVLSHYYPEDSEKLAVKASSLVFVLARGVDGWAMVIHDGQKLRIPSSLLEPASKMDKWKISNGIPLPPAQVPPSRLHVKQKPGSPLGQGHQWVLYEAVPKPLCFRGTWGGWLPTAAMAACVLAGAVPLLFFCSAESPGGENASLNDAQMDFKVSSVLRHVLFSPFCKRALPSNYLLSLSPSSCATFSVSVDRPVVLRAHCECTMVVRAGEVPSLPDLRALLRERFGQQAERGKLSYRNLDGKELGAVSGEEDLGKMWQQLTYGRLTLCCQDSDSHSGRPVLYRMLAQHSYLAQGPGDLEFSKGDVLDVLSEVNEDWLEGHCDGKTGIFPKCFATQTAC